MLRPATARRRPGRLHCAAARSTASSRRFKVVVPEIEVHRIAIRRPAPPELTCREANRVEVLRLVAEALRLAVIEDEHAVVALDRAEPAARVAWQARVRSRVDVAC